MVVERKKMNTLYMIEVKIKKQDVNMVVKDSDIKIWYKRLSHNDEKGLETLVEKISTQLHWYITQDLCLLHS